MKIFRLDWYEVHTIYHWPDGGAHGDQRAKALTKLQAAVILGDLRNPPSNRFEALHGDRSGQYSIRINAQYRVCFKWAPHASIPAGTDALQASGDAYDVEITDYH